MLYCYNCEYSLSNHQAASGYSKSWSWIPLCLTWCALLFLFQVGECSYNSSRSYSSSRAVSTESLSVQETARPSYSSHPDLCCTPLCSEGRLWGRLQNLPSCNSYSQECVSSQEASLISETDCSLAVQGLRNYVTQADRSYVAALAKEVVRAEEERKEEYGEEDREECDINEGILFKEVILTSWGLLFSYNSYKWSSTCFLVISYHF